MHVKINQSVYHIVHLTLFLLFDISFNDYIDVSGKAVHDTMVGISLFNCYSHGHIFLFYFTGILFLCIVSFFNVVKFLR